MITITQDPFVFFCFVLLKLQKRKKDGGGFNTFDMHDCASSLMIITSIKYYLFSIIESR
jgi:hypothetical protein